MAATGPCRVSRTDRRGLPRERPRTVRGPFTHPPDRQGSVPGARIRTVARVGVDGTAGAR